MALIASLLTVAAASAEPSSPTSNPTLQKTALSSPERVQSADDAALAEKPPLGWNSWNAYRCDITDAKVREAADALVSTGMKDVGYSYVIIDDCWSNGRDSAGNLRPDPAKFPGGMKTVADYVHSKGLKFGMYAAPMAETCAHYEGSLGHERQDAQQFAAWGVDYLKYDWCDTGGTLEDQREHFALMRDALRETGRPILYNINPGSAHAAEYASVHDFGDYAHSTRIGEDLLTSWWTSGSGPSHYPMGTLNNIDLAAPLSYRSSPQRWNDWDMLQVGNGQMPVNEARAQFSLWAVGGSPLIAGNNIATMSRTTRDILTNSELIQVNQSWGGSAGRRVYREGDAEVWAKPLADGDVAVLLLNRGDQPRTVETSAAAVNLGGSDSYRLRDLWTGEHTATRGTISASVPARDVVVQRLERTGKLHATPPRGTHAVSEMDWASSNNAWGPVERNRSNGEDESGDGRPLSIGGAVYPKGLGVHAQSAVNLWLGGSCKAFSAKVGVDDEVGTGRGSVRFEVYGDGRLLASTEPRSAGQAAIRVSANLKGAKSLELRATSTVDGIDYDHADWGEASIRC